MLSVWQVPVTVLVFPTTLVPAFQLVRFSTVFEFVRFPIYLSVCPISNRSCVRLIPTVLEFVRFPTPLSVRPISDRSGFAPLSSVDFQHFLQFVRFPTNLEFVRFPTFLSVHPNSDLSFSSFDFRSFSSSFDFQPFFSPSGFRSFFQFVRFPTVL